MVLSDKSHEGTDGEKNGKNGEESSPSGSKGPTTFASLLAAASRRLEDVEPYDDPHDDETSQFLLALVDRAEEIEDRVLEAEARIVRAEDEEATRLAKVERFWRRLNAVLRLVTTSAFWLATGTVVVRLAVSADLIPWLKGVLAGVSRGALDSGFGLTVPLIVAAGLFRKELIQWFRRNRDPGER